MNKKLSLCFLSFLVTLLPIFSLRSQDSRLNKLIIEKIKNLYESSLGYGLLNNGKYSKDVMNNYYYNTLRQKKFLELHHLYLNLTDQVLMSANNVYDTLRYSSIAGMTIGVLYGLYNAPIDTSKDSFQTISEKKFFSVLKSYFFVFGVSFTLRELFLYSEDKLYEASNVNYFVGYFVAISILVASLIKSKKYISSKIKGFSCLKKS